jgi:hypothetical protein
VAALGAAAAEGAWTLGLVARLVETVRPAVPLPAWWEAGRLVFRHDPGEPVFVIAGDDPVATFERAPGVFETEGPVESGSDAPRLVDAGGSLVGRILAAPRGDPEFERDPVEGTGEEGGPSSGAEARLRWPFALAAVVLLLGAAVLPRPSENGASRAPFSS